MTTTKAWSSRSFFDRAGEGEPDTSTVTFTNSFSKEEGAYRVMKALGVKAEDCLYMGDTNTDMRTAANAGLDAVGAAWGFRGREELEAFHPKFLADSPGELLEMLGLEKFY